MLDAQKSSAFPPRPLRRAARYSRPPPSNDRDDLSTLLRSIKRTMKSLLSSNLDARFRGRRAGRAGGGPQRQRSFVTRTYLSPILLTSIPRRMGERYVDVGKVRSRSGAPRGCPGTAPAHGPGARPARPLKAGAGAPDAEPHQTLPGQPQHASSTPPRQCGRHTAGTRHAAGTRQSHSRHPD